jgi:cell division protease FtsH
MIEIQYQRAIDLLNNHKEKLRTLAELLLEKEVIFKDDLEKLFGKRPFGEALEELKVNEVKEEDMPAVDKVTEE